MWSSDTNFQIIFLANFHKKKLPIFPALTTILIKFRSEIALP